VFTWAAPRYSKDVRVVRARGRRRGAGHVRSRRRNVPANLYCACV